MRMFLLVSMLGVAVGDSSGGGSLEVQRTFHANGRPYEVRRFREGREEGLQQAWTEDGVLYLNYEMRHGRRYGVINPRPCAPVKEVR